MSFTTFDDLAAYVASPEFNNDSLKHQAVHLGGATAETIEGKSNQAMRMLALGRLKEMRQVMAELYADVLEYKASNPDFIYNVGVLPTHAQVVWIKLEREAILVDYLSKVATNSVRDSPLLIASLAGISPYDQYLVCKLFEYANSYMFSIEFTTRILKAIRALLTYHFKLKYKLSFRIPRTEFNSLTYNIWRRLQGGSTVLDKYTMNYIEALLIQLTENRIVLD